MRAKTIAVAVAALAAAATVAGASDRGEREEHGEREHHGRREGGGEREGRAASHPADAAARALYRKECGACHLDFPPGFLPAESHRRILAGLERHFGQNAELDPAVRAEVERFLVKNAAEAGSDRRSLKTLASVGPGEGPLRITELPWFQRKHRRASAEVVARPSVGTRANCAACHPGAARWDFEDDRVMIPRAP